jgi:hypothetical protein
VPQVRHERNAERALGPLESELMATKRVEDEVDMA